jgi:hypothetical protein
MNKYRFRRTVDIDVEAESPEKAREELSKRDRYPDEFELMGHSEIRKLKPELLKAASSLSGFVIMAVQYRGENFPCLCKTEDLGERVSVQPVALLLNEEQKDHITDVMGQRPESGQRNKRGD